MKILFSLFFLFFLNGFSNAGMSQENVFKSKSLYDRDLSNYNYGDLITNKGILISQSDIILDCKGKILDGEGKISTGILIESYGKKIKNIKIKNCIFQNYKFNAIRIGWGVEDIYKDTIDKSKIYDYHPSNIQIENVKIINSGSVGLYIDDYVHNVNIKDSFFYFSGAPAIYLEFSSKDNVIKNNYFYKNGFNLKKGNRETISIDGSFNNKIISNKFESNLVGSIFLYKNCQENVSKGKSVVRKYGANNNLIAFNEFKNEKIGIWIASRQSKNLSKWDCGDKPIYKNIYYQDYADYNKVEDNSFVGVEKAIIVEGDYNTIKSNNFDRKINRSIFFPKTKRFEFMHKPQIGNLVLE
ncbi:right-handed parallel beta-helix repeat-containing protein [Acinetobacter soli]|uniref:right-handed parallel beta-helix repeat-containing protein n=1 Tax=Acinetobacter soli TaxID=487316 RepID=UPI00370C97AD